MKEIIIFSIIFTLISCEKSKKIQEEKDILIKSNYFSVSENNLKLDSLSNVHKKNSLEVLEFDEKYNENYIIGAIHFLIVDKNNSFFVVNYLEPFILMCGNTEELTSRDSINFVNKNTEVIKKIKPIPTKEITKILYKYKSKIIENEINRIPLLISFGLKNDTLNGNTMYNIVKFMENNKMERYLIRRMNNDELNMLNH